MFATSLIERTEVDMELKYRLQDPAFKDSIFAGITAVDETEGLNAFLIGGGAVQVYSWSEDLRRPTLDVDIQSKQCTKGRIGKEWGERALSNLRKKGYAGKLHKVRTGTEIALEGYTPPFFLHLDSFSPKFRQAHREVIDATFERKRNISLNGKEEGEYIYIQAPEDILAFKMRRLVWVAEQGNLGRYDELQVRLIADGLIDDANTEGLAERLERVGGARIQTVEEIARQGFEHAQHTVERYKTEKNLYDVLLLVESHRRQAIFENPGLIPATLKELRKTT